MLGQAGGGREREGWGGGGDVGKRRTLANQQTHLTTNSQTNHPPTLPSTHTLHQAEHELAREREILDVYIRPVNCEGHNDQGDDLHENAQY